MAHENPEPDRNAEDLLDDPVNYINRELSMLKFHRRVLYEAQNNANPLLERVRFLGIVGSILDEFFMVRVGGLSLGLENPQEKFYFEGMDPQKQLYEIRKETRKIMREAQDCFLKTLMPQLAKEGIKVLSYAALNKAQKARMDAHFMEVIFPVLTPLGFDPGHPFPHISNLSYNLAILVEDDHRRRHFARLKVPGTLPYFLPVHKSAYDPTPRVKRVHKYEFVLISEVISANLSSLFPGMKVIEAHPFHVVRNVEIEPQGIELMDLLEVMAESVRRRRFGAVVRLLVREDMPDYVLKILVENLEVEPQFIFPLPELVILRHLAQIAQIDRPDLKFPGFSQTVPKVLQFGHDSSSEQFFQAIQRQDIMLHHPYESFDPVVEFIRHAAVDPDVLAIKQTLYRVGRNSPVIRTLLQARRDFGKQVAVLVELKARFDEESNIEWAKLLEQEGVHVTYGLMGLKTHSKIVLVVRKEKGRIRRYVHLATGNYNHITAQAYEDIGMFTCDDEIGADATDLFNYLTGYSAKEDYRKLIVAPVQLREQFHELICREMGHQREHGDAHIILKMNALVDGDIVRLLYRASQAGVKVDLIVRGICSLRPGVVGLSENIRVISVLGRFLEHSRIYYFHNHGKEKIYMGSADLMPRNLNQRVEVLFPVQSPAMIRHLRDDVLEAYLREDIKAWRMRPDGSYDRTTSKDGMPLIDIQEWFLSQW